MDLSFLSGILCPIIAIVQGVVDGVLGTINGILSTEFTFDIGALLGLDC